MVKVRTCEAKMVSSLDAQKIALPQFPPALNALRFTSGLIYNDIVGYGHIKIHGENLLPFYHNQTQVKINLRAILRTSQAFIGKLGRKDVESPEYPAGIVVILLNSGSDILDSGLVVQEGACAGVNQIPTKLRPKWLVSIKSS